MIKQFLTTVTDGSQQKVIEEAQIVGYYVPPLADSVVRMAVAVRDSATLQKLMLVTGWNILNKAILQIDFLGSILKDLNTRAIADTNEPYPEIMLTVASKEDDKKKKNSKKKKYFKK